MASVILDVWHAEEMGSEPVHIYPDGCRDVIWYRLKGAPPRWKVSTLDPTVRCLSGIGGAHMRGFRLAPGASISPVLLRVLDPEAPDTGIDEIAALSMIADPVAELMAACRDAPVAGVERLARRMGVSVRSLQRMARTRTGQGPLFWLRLIRLRRALSSARDGGTLAEVAADAGFADQSHFTREARAFHGASPTRLLADPRAMAAIIVPGL